MKGSIAAINQEARERGMSYGKYLAFRAAQEAPAPGREGKTTAKPKRSMPPGAGLEKKPPRCGRQAGRPQNRYLHDSRLERKKQDGTETDLAGN